MNTGCFGKPIILSSHKHKMLHFLLLFPTSTKIEEVDDGFVEKIWKLSQEEGGWKQVPLLGGWTWNLPADRRCVLRGDGRCRLPGLPHPPRSPRAGLQVVGGGASFKLAGSFLISFYSLLQRRKCYVQFVCHPLSQIQPQTCVICR